MMNETDCPTCKYPTFKTREHRLKEVCQFVVPRHTNTLIVPNYGEVPILKGDVSWLSPDVYRFVSECVQLTTPSSIRLCNGSVFEAQELRDAIGNEFRTDEQKQLDRFHLSLADIGYDDVHVITKDRVDAEPSGSSCSGDQSPDSRENAETVRMSSQYMTPANFDFSKTTRFSGAMTGRTMYVVPFSMNLIGGRNAVYGVQITDDPVLVLHLRSTFRVLSSVWDCIAATSHFIKCAHTIGMPRPIIRSVVKSAPLENLTGSFIVLKHDEHQVWAHGHAFGRTLRFGKTFSIYASSWLGAKGGWLAEPGCILAITNPKNVKIHVCYRTHTSLESLELNSGLAPGWKIEVVSARSVWVHWHEGKLHAIAPENDEMSETNTVPNFRNLLNGSSANYQIQSFNPQKTKWPSEVGVPIAAYIFANRRHDQFPLILETHTWQDGVVLAAGIRVAVSKAHVDTESGDSTREQTSILRKVLVECPMLRVDPIHFSFARYLNHWLAMGVGVESHSAEKADDDKPAPPPIFFTNLSQEIDKKVVWPGGADNARIFEYIFNRCTNPSDLSNTTSTGLGKIPKSLETSGLVNLPPLLQVDVRFWLQELTKLRSFFKTQMGTCLPSQLDKVLTDLAGAV